MRSDRLNEIFNEILTHRAEHACGGYPYEYGQILSTLVRATESTKILELGTGLGYTAICLALGNPDAHIETIDQNNSHVQAARMYWDELAIADRIAVHEGKAEGILPDLTETYDFIFFDGYAPSMKFLIHFERLLKKNGVLVTANFFVKDQKGGKYLRALNNAKKWQTGIFADTAISVKLN